MLRPTALALPALMILMIVPAVPATGSIADVIPLDCWNPNGTWGNFNLPDGWYTVTVTGACSYGTTSLALNPCQMSTGYVVTGPNGCAPSAWPDCFLGVEVEGQCVTFAPVVAI